MRYHNHNRQTPNAIFEAQSKLYLAKSLVDACVTTALAFVAIVPEEPMTYFIDLGVSIIVAAYLVVNGLITIRKIQSHI